MTNGAVLIPIVVAIIGVMGAIIPIYVKDLVTPEHPNPGINIHVNASEKKLDPYLIEISNDGSAPATNLNITLNTFPADIINITDKFSTVDLFLPSINTTLVPGNYTRIGDPLLEIQIPELIHGSGSIIQLEAFVNKSEFDNDPMSDFCKHGKIYAVYEQGSTTSDSFCPTTLSFSNIINEHYQKWGIFYSIFYIALFGLFFLYIKRRRSFKRYLTNVVKNVMEIRGKLRDDITNRDIFQGVWYNLSENKRQDSHDIGDFLLIEDFYSELRKRNSYISTTKPIDVKMVVHLNKICLEGAEKVLKDIDWNKHS